MDKGNDNLEIYANGGSATAADQPPAAASPVESMADAALRYHAAGLRITTWKPDPDPKKQFAAWAQYRTSQSVEQVRAITKKPFERLAILTGVDDLEAIDIDVKHDPKKTIDKEFSDKCREYETPAAALAKCVIVRTKSGGLHIIYRAENVERNQKLAHREGGKEAVIETRGIGGLIYAAPSPGYTLEQGDYCNIQTLTNDERNALISVARMLSHRSEVIAAGEKPGEAYNAANTVLELAIEYGWREVSRSGDIIHLTRPGAKNPNGVDASILTSKTGEQLFYPFSTSTAFDPEKCYSPFAMYAVEKHRGNFIDAARELGKLGYGTPPDKKKQKNDPGESDPTVPIFNEDLYWKEEKFYRWKTWAMVKGVPVAGKIEPIANFVINPLYHLSDPRNPKRVFEIINQHGQRSVVCASVKELASLEGFKAVVEGRGNYVFYGSARQYSAIKEVWYYFEKTAIEIGTLGHIPGTKLYAWANGVFDGDSFHAVDEFGIVEVAGDRYFIPVFSSLYNGDEGMFQREKKFLHNTASKVSFEKWAKVFCDAFSENENGRIALIFACAALFRTTITAHTNFFPMLFFFGMKGTGKSTARDAMLCLFGQPQDAVSLGSASSPKGFSRSLSQRRDALMVFEEYKNSIPLPLIEMLKNVFDGIGYERAQTTNDNKTHTTGVLSAVVVAGQELPVKENALHSRMITLEYQKTTFSDEQVTAYNELADLQKGDGVTAVTLEVLHHRSCIESLFVASYREMCVMLKEGKAPSNLSIDEADIDARLPHNIDERSINNTALLLAVYRILEGYLKFPFTFAELMGTLVSKLKMQVEIMNKTTEVCVFWQSVEVLREQVKLLEGRDFKIEKRDNEEWILIYPTTVFAAYEEHQRRVGGHALDGATLTRYLKRQSGYRPGKDRGDWVVRLGERPGEAAKQKRCLAFEINSTQNF